MKYFVIFLVLVGFIGVASALEDETSNTSTISLEEHYEIEIIELQDEYMVGEEYSFYYVISGYGHSCVNYQASYLDENGNKYMLKTSLSLDELILVAESLQ